MLFYICIFILFTSFVFGVFSFRKNKCALLLSAYFIILATYGLTHYFTSFDRSDFWLAIFYNHFTPIWVMAGPVLYFYVKTTIEDAEKLPPYTWVHFIPSIAYLVSIGPYLVMPFSEKLRLAHLIHTDIDQLKNVQTNLVFSPALNFIVRPSLVLIYALISLIHLIRFNNTQPQSSIIPTEQKRITMRWLLVFVCTNLGLSISFLVISILFVQQPNSGHQLLNHPLHIVTGCLFLSLTVVLFFFPQILYGFPHSKMDASVHNEENVFHSKDEKAERKPLDENDPFISLSNRIKVYLEEEKPYLSKDFSMHDIAVAMDVPNHHISYCLNQVMQTNFANLKNQLRVEHSIAQLNQMQHTPFSIEGIAQNSGFATRSSFYAAFKKITGTTPTEYLQQIHQKDSTLEHTT